LTSLEGKEAPTFGGFETTISFNLREFLMIEVKIYGKYTGEIVENCGT